MTCPECAAGERPHGTRARYVHGPGPGSGPGCRCEACRAASREARNRRARLQAYGRWEPFTDAGSAREHVRVLAEAGIGWRQAAALAGIPQGTMQKLLRGPSRSERLRPETAAAILAVQPAAANLAAGTPVDAGGTRRRLQALVRIGWSQARLGGQLGITPPGLGAMMRRQQVTAGTARSVAALYDRLWNQQPPQATHHEKAAASRARNYARARGWAPPLAWDEDQLDAPAGQPANGWQRRAGGRRTAAELAAEAEDIMRRQGHTIDQAAERLSVTRSAIEHAARRAREAAGRAQAAAEREHQDHRARFAACHAKAPEPGIGREAG